MDLIGKILELHDALTAAELPHAFGGALALALALAWCTQRARGTIDIDVNVLVPVDEQDRVIAALPGGVAVTDADRRLLARDGQARFWWDRTPVDVFLSRTEFHDRIAARVRWETFAGRGIPFLSCFDPAVFKASFDRSPDWADLEAMRDAGTLEVADVAAVLVAYLGAEDPRIGRLEALRRD